MMTKKFLLVLLFGVILTGVAWAERPINNLPKAINEELNNLAVSALTPDFSQSRSLPYLSNDTILFENVIVGSQRYAILMRWQSNVLKPVWSGVLNKVEIPFRTITIDGNNADWAGISPVVKDPTGDDIQYLDVPGTDLANVYMARDNSYLYYLMTLHDGNPNPENQTLYTVEFQQYLTQIHTPGDRITHVSYLPEKGWFLSVGDRTGASIAEHPSDHVGTGAGMLEWKVPIVDIQYPPDTPLPYYSPIVPPPGIENQFIRAYIHPGPHPNPPPVSDSNDDLTRAMIINFY